MRARPTWSWSVCPAPRLADEIARGPLSLARLRAVLDNVLDAVAAAHAAGILHRDIKPGNILLGTSAGAMKVADFGISKTVDTAPTRTGEVLGTMAYLSPQRVSGAPASPADDLYAVGVVAYEALTGWPPFRGDNPGALARSILDDVPPPVTAVPPRRRSDHCRGDLPGDGAKSRAAVRLCRGDARRRAWGCGRRPWCSTRRSRRHRRLPSMFRRRDGTGRVRTKILVGAGAAIAVLTGGIAFAAIGFGCATTGFDLYPSAPARSPSRLHQRRRRPP